jgi:hypothetical protein
LADVFSLPEPGVRLLLEFLHLQESEGPRYGDFFDGPHEGGEVQNLWDKSEPESETEWMEVEENNKDGTDVKSDEEEEMHMKKVR